MGRPGSSSRRASYAGSARPGRRPRSRPARRGRWRGRSGRTSAISIAASGPPTLESLTPVSAQAPDRHRPLGVGAALDALVGGDRDRGRRRDLGRLLQGGDRLLGELDLERLQRPASVSPCPGPRRHWRRRGSAPRPHCLAHRPNLGEIVAGAELQLEGRKPSAAQRAASAATAAGSPATSVALHSNRLRGVLLAAGGHEPSVAAPAPRRSSSAVRRARGREARETARRPAASPRRGRRGSPSETSSSSTTRPGRPRRAATAAPLRPARPAPRRSAVAAAPSRAGRARPRAVT